MHRHHGSAALAKPEILDRAGLGRMESWVTFEAKKPTVFQMEKRGGTGEIATLGDHNSAQLLRIEPTPMRPVLQIAIGQ